MGLIVLARGPDGWPFILSSTTYIFRCPSLITFFLFLLLLVIHGVFDP
jgi:hypothetical protein